MAPTARFPRKRRHVNIQVEKNNWREEQREAIAAHNQRVTESGPLLVPDWTDVNGVSKGEPWL